MPKPASPKIIDLELTAYCNTACAFCPREKLTRPQGFMSAMTLDKVLSGLKQEPPYIINCSGMGECLLHPRLPELIRQIKRSLNCIVGLTTNGSLLDEKNCRRLLNTPLDFFTISYNGSRRVLQNIRQLARLRQRTGHRPALNITTLEHVPKKKLYDFWSSAGVDGVIRQPLHNRGGHLKTRQKRVFTKPCAILNNSLFITWQGRVLSCCHDLEGKNILGDLTKEPLAKILRQRAPYLSRLNPYPLCRACNDTLRAQYFSKERYLACKK